MSKDKPNLEKLLANLGSTLNDIVTTAISVEDVRASRTESLDFNANESGVYGKGLFWKGTGNTKQFIYRANPDRIWTTESIDLQAGEEYMIGNVGVVSETTLGPTVTQSSLSKVGTLKQLKTTGDLVIDDFIFYSSANNRLGFGTEDPNGTFTITSLDSEFVIDLEGPDTRIGNYTNDDLEIVTDDTARIVVSGTGKVTIGSDIESKTTVKGKLGINVNNPDEALTVAGAIKFNDTKMDSGPSAPTGGTYTKGSVVWNTDPKPTGYVGWVCVRAGSPGMWKPFGQIAS